MTRSIQVQLVGLTVKGAFDRVEDILFYSDVVSHYSTCALIQRSVSPGNMTFSQDCLQSSRSALDAHKRASAQFNKKGQEELWSGYVHWSILQAPFTPYADFMAASLSQLINIGLLSFFATPFRRRIHPTLAPTSNLSRSLSRVSNLVVQSLKAQRSSIECVISSCEWQDST